MVAIRLSRTGAKKKPSYRVVVIDKRRARDSRNIEIVGHYNPRPDPIEVVLKRDRIDHWVGVGAQLSETVKRLVKQFDARIAAEAAQNGTAPVEEKAAVAEAPAAPAAEAAASVTAQPGEPVPVAEGEEEDEQTVEYALEEESTAETVESEPAADLEESAKESS